MIDGLKLTFSGTQLIAHLEERLRFHAQSDARAELRQARLQALTLIRDHIVETEVYRLGEYDLRFADLLPDETWLDCGCLDRWRHDDDDTSGEDLVTAAAATRRADP